METAHLVLRTQFTKHLTELQTAFLMPEMPRLRMEINTIASLLTLVFVSFLTLDYCINVLEDHPHLLQSSYVIGIYITQLHAKHHSHVNKKKNKRNHLFHTKPVVSTVGSNWDKRADEVKSLVTIPSVIKGKGTQR